MISEETLNEIARLRDERSELLRKIETIVDKQVELIRPHLDNDLECNTACDVAGCRETRRIIDALKRQQNSKKEYEEYEKRIADQGIEEAV